MDELDGKSLVIPSLGLPFQLGMLYDRCRDCLMDQISLWEKPLLENSTVSNKEHTSCFTVITSDFFADKADHLGISAGLKLSILSNLTSTHGSSRYIHDNKMSRYQSRIVLKHTVSTHSYTLDFAELRKWSVLPDSKVSKATHVVTKIVFGSNTFFVFDYELNEEEKIQEIQNQMYVIADALAKTKEMENIDQSLIDQTRCKLYSDSPIPKVPTTLKEAMEVIQKHSFITVGNNDCVSVPIMVTLDPVSKYFKQTTPKVTVVVSETLLLSIQNTMENLQKLEVHSNDLQKNETCMKFTSLHKQLVKFKELKQRHTLHLTSELSDKVPRIRTGEINETSLHTFVSGINNSPFAFEILSSWLENKGREIGVLTNYLNRLKEVKFCSCPSEFVDNPEYKSVVCFNIFIVEDDELLNDMTQYQRNFKTPKRPFEQKSITPWFKNAEILTPMRERFRQFKAFVEKHECSTDIKCLVTSMRPLETGATAVQIASITVYQDGVKQESEPGIPGQPQVTATTASSISLKWSDQAYGMTELSTYVVSYCLAECHPKKWVSIETKSCEKQFTIINLQPKTAYYLKVKPVDSEFSFESPVSALTRTKQPSASPGKPIARDIKSNAVQLEWTKPEYNAENVESYSVLCVSKATNEPVLPLIHCTTEKCTICVEGLSSETAYIFTVMANYGKGKESCKSKPSDSIKTKQSFHPGHPKIVEVDSNSVHIEWSEPECSESMKLLYTIQLSDSVENDWKEVQDLKNEIQCKTVIRNLKPKTKYKFKVVAKCAEYEEEWESESSESIETLPSCCPGKPSGISSDCDKIMLTWQKPECSHDRVQCYTVSYCVDDVAECWKKASKTQDLEMLICELEAKTSYKFKVMAKCGDTVCESEPSESVWTKPSRCPRQPIASSIHNNGILLKWLQPEFKDTDVQSYCVLYCFNSNDNAVTEDHWLKATEDITYKSLEMVKLNLSSKSVYKFKVVATYADRKDKVWESEPSKPIETLPSYRPGQPIAANIDCNSVHLVWSKPTHIGKEVKSYTVLLSLSDTSNTWLEAHETKDITELEKEVFDLKPNQHYRFKVVANYSEEGDESWPGIASEPIQTKLSRYPGKPKPTKVESNTIFLKWAKPQYSDEPVNTYTVLFHRQNSKDTTSAQNGQSINWQVVEEFEKKGETEFAIFKLMSKTVYIFKIVAKFLDSDKDWYSEESIPIPTKPSLNPGKPEAVKVDYDRIELKWKTPDNVEDVEFYTILHSICSPKEMFSSWKKVEEWKILASDQNHVVISIQELQQNSHYYFKVIANHGSTGDTFTSEPSEQVTTLSRHPGKPFSKHVDLNKVVLAWEKPTCSDQPQIYSIYFTEDSASKPTPEWQKISKDMAQTTSEPEIIIDGLTSHTCYTFKIVAHYGESHDGCESELSTPIKTELLRCPGKPTAKFVNSTRIHLHWTTPKSFPENVHCYIIKCFSGEHKPEREVETANRDILIEDLIPNTTYTFQTIACYDDKINLRWPSESSNPITTKPSRLPGAPEAVSVGCSEIHLEWKEPEYVEEKVLHYSLFIKNLSESEGWKTITERTFCTGCTVYKLNTQSKFIFKVCAKFESGLEVESKESEIMVTERSRQPGKPFAAHKDSNEVLLKWKEAEYDAENIQWYIIRYSAKSSNKQFQIRVSGPSNQALIAQLVPKEVYKFQLEAQYKQLTTSFLSQWSDPISTPPSRSPGKPVASELNDYILLDWKEPEYEATSVLRYKVLYKEFSCEQFEEPLYVSSSSFELKIMHVQPKTTYVFKVVAECKRGNYESEVTKLTTKPSPIPGKPCKTIVDCDKVELEWTAPKHDLDIRRYSIEYQPCNEPNEKFHEVELKGKKTKGTVTGLVPKTLYYFRICVEYEMSTYKFRSELSDQILTLPSRAPSGLTAKHVTNCSICLTWKEPECKQPPVQAYRIEYSEHTSKQGVKYISTENSPPEKELVVPNLIPSTTYSFQISSLYEHGQYLSNDILKKMTEEDCCPGEPKLAQKTQCSITVKWEAPKYGNYDVQYYTVQQRNATDATNNWRTVIERTSNMSATIENLTHDTDYYFRIIPYTFTLSSSSSENKEPFCTNPVPLSIHMRDISSKISKQGAEPAIYELPKKREFFDPKNHISKFSVGEKPFTTQPQEIVMMVVGATGAGKSTLINGMINYILGVKWEDRFRFKLIVENEAKSQIHSQTKWITSYTIHHMKGSEINYTLTVIDTPGFGDTGGIERDKQLVLQIKEFFSINDCIDALHGIGFVAQAPLARLTPTQHYIFQSILAIFGKDIATNIMVMVTFADSNDPPVLKAIKAAGVPFQYNFTFNNSALFTNSAVVGKQHRFGIMYWEMGMESFKEFFCNLVGMECRSLRLTKEVLQERCRLESIVQGLQPHIQIGLGKIDELEQEEQMLEQHRAQVEAYEDFTYTVEIPKIRKVNLPTGTYVTNCVECNFTCHENCRIPESKDKFRCSAMEFQGNESKAKCKVCPQHCKWEEHCNNEFKFETYTATEKRQYSDLKQRYENAKSGETEVGSIIKQLQEELQSVQETVLRIVADAHECLKRLDEIALKPNPLTQVEYIELLINSEKQDCRKGWKKRVKTLNQLKRKAAFLNNLRHPSVTDNSGGKSWWKKWVEDTSSIF